MDTEPRPRDDAEDPLELPELPDAELPDAELPNQELRDEIASIRAIGEDR